MSDNESTRRPSWRGELPEAEQRSDVEIIRAAIGVERDAEPWWEMADPEPPVPISDADLVDRVMTAACQILARHGDIDDDLVERLNEELAKRRSSYRLVKEPTA